MLPFRYFKNRTSGEIITRINDLSIINETIIKIIITIVLDLSLMLFSGIMLLIINYKIFVISLFVLLLYTLVIKLFDNKLYNKLLILKEKQTKINSFTLESINSFETIKGLGIEKIIINTYKENNDVLNDNQYEFDKLYNLEHLFNNLINDIGLCLIVFIGSLLVIKNDLI